MMTSTRSRRSLWAPLLLLVFLTGLGFALVRGEVTGLRAAGLGLAGGVTLWFLHLFVDSVQDGQWPAFESHWGGLGGGLGGWRVSPSLLYLMGALGFASAVVALGAERTPDAPAAASPLTTPSLLPP